METKTCKTCGEILPLSHYRRTRWGGTADVCNACISCKSAEAREKNRGGDKHPPFSDPDFDGKDPGEVVRMMGRAKRWLESRGFIIHLDGEFHETKIRKLKFE